MKSNEEYLDELLKSMGEENTEDTALNRLQGEFWDENTEEVNIVPDVIPTPAESNTGKMDQSMIDALLAAAGGAEEVVEEAPPVMVDQSAIDAMFASAGSEEIVDEPMMMEQSELDALLASEVEEAEEVQKESTPVMVDQSAIDAMFASAGSEEIADEPMMMDQLELDALLASEAMDISEENSEDDSSSMLAQLMAEMEAEALMDGNDNFDDSMLTEDSIEALLNAAQSGSDSGYVEEPLSFDIQNDSDMADIEALLDMSDKTQILDENDALLQMLEAAEKENSVAPSMGTEEALQLDLEQLDALLTPGGVSSEGGETKGKEEGKKKKEKKKKEKKEKTEGGKKGLLEKIFSILMEEVPEEDLEDKTLNLSDENKEVLNQLEQEEDKKIKVKEKKDKKEKKNKKEKPKKEKKPQKEKKPKKEKKPRKEKEPYIPEKRIPRAKVIVTVIFAASVMALILLVEYLVPPMLSVGRARAAYDKGQYYEAYKEYYGQKLSEEDEKKFQGATTIMRMQSNLDGYHNYIKMNQEVKALHSLLEAVHVKFDVFLKAEEFNVFTQVSIVYDEILGILSSKYHLTEDDAMNLVGEKSDVSYTHKLESIVEYGEYTDDSSDIDQSDLLPEEEALFLDSGE